MQKEQFNNGMRMQCLDVETLSMVQFDLSVASFKGLLTDERIKGIKRIVASGCGDSYLAAEEAKEAFARYLPDVAYEAPNAMDAARYIDFKAQEPDTLVVAISVSGSAARVTEILERGKKYGCITMALTANTESRAAKAAELTYHTNTPQGDNMSGLRSYYASMISLYVMAACMAEVRSGKALVEELRHQVEAYRNAFFAEMEAIDALCFETAVQWKDKKFFEVTADGPLFYCGKFISAKFAELSGDVCSVIDSENYFHVNSIMYPGEHFGEMALLISHQENCERVVAAVNSQVSRGKRSVIVFSDKPPVEVGITEEVVYCHLPIPPREQSFLLPLFSYIPAAILAGYRSATIGEPFFRGGAFFSGMTLGSNPVRVV